MSTTLTEVKNKSDVIILFSNKILSSYPRLIEKFLATQNSFSVNAKNKKIYIIVDKKNNLKDLPLKDKRITLIDFNNKNIPILMDSLINKINKINLIIMFSMRLEKISKVKIFISSMGDFRV